MAGLDTLFQNVGPASASLQGGLDVVAAEQAAQSEQAMRQAQMDKIIQETAHARDMNPLELKAKQVSNAAEELKANAAKADFRSELVGRMIPLVEQTPPAARLAVMKQFAEENGLPMDESHLQRFAQIPADQLPKFLTTQRENDIRNSEKYRQAMDVAREHSRSAMAVENAREASRERTAAAKLKTGEQTVLGFKKASEKEAGYNDLAMQAEFSGDILKAQEYKRKAASFKEQASRERAENQQAAQAAAEKARATQQMVNQFMPGQTTPALPPQGAGTAASPIILR